MLEFWGIDKVVLLGLLQLTKCFPQFHKLIEQIASKGFEAIAQAPTRALHSVLQYLHIDFHFESNLQLPLCRQPAWNLLCYKLLIWWWHCTWRGWLIITQGIYCWNCRSHPFNSRLWNTICLILGLYEFFKKHQTWNLWSTLLTISPVKQCCWVKHPCDNHLGHHQIALDQGGRVLSDLGPRQLEAQSLSKQMASAHGFPRIGMTGFPRSAHCSPNGQWIVPYCSPNVHDDILSIDLAGNTSAFWCMFAQMRTVKRKDGILWCGSKIICWYCMQHIVSMAFFSPGLMVSKRSWSQMVSIEKLAFRHLGIQTPRHSNRTEAPAWTK